MAGATGDPRKMGLVEIDVVDSPLPRRRLVVLGFHPPPGADPAVRLNPDGARDLAAGLLEAADVAEGVVTAGD